MGIKKLIAKAGAKAADKVANLAVLSPGQLADIQQKKEMYMSQVPDPNDDLSIELTNRYLAACGVEIYNAYLPQIHDLYYPIEKEFEYDREFAEKHNIRFFNITKWVTDKKENSLEKLVNVYAVLSNECCNIALVFNRTVTTTNVYLAVANMGNADNNADVDQQKKRLLEAVKGNFPGSEFGSVNGVGVVPCLMDTDGMSVACASNIPNEKSEKFISQTIEKILDGIVPERHEQDYTIVLLATPILDTSERKMKISELYSALAPYEKWSTTFTYVESASDTSSATFGVNVGASAGIQRGQNQSVTDSQGVTDSSSTTNTDNTSTTNTDSSSTTDTASSSSTNTDSLSTNTSHTDGSSITDTRNSSTTDTVGGSASSTAGSSYTVGTSDTTGTTTTHGVNSSVADSTNTNAGIAFVASVGMSGGTTNSHGSSTSVANNASNTVNSSFTQNISNTLASNFSKAVTNGTSQAIASNVSNTVGQTIGSSLANTIGSSVANTVGKSVANTVGKSVANTLGKAISNTVAKTAGTSRTINYGANFGANFARSSNVTATIGKNESINQNYVNHNIKHTLEYLEEQMKRYEQSTALGMWDFAAYVVSSDYNVANNVACSYLALTEGEKSYLSQTAVNLWRGDRGYESGDAKEICSYIKDLRHPLFGLKPDRLVAEPTFFVYPEIVTATTSLSGKELAYSLNFPKTSVTGLPVLECAEFGRNIVEYGNNDNGVDINIGNIFHMNHEEKTEVKLNVNSLASHVFITGSTGAGKSNTIYKILDEVTKLGKTFLVIEPAKGEYKNVFGNRADVKVFGTNPNYSELLKINPFSFADGIHVFEHIDRLVEIFCICWPMYAAMPAVLKNAIEKSYEDCGWDLTESTNRFGEGLFPNFKDVARNIRTIIDTSEYDSENKGAYKGSLLTRLQSLTNGINGLIFSEDAISDEDLFRKNVIVDLSRVGSVETKSLIMGMLVLKLQEYHISCSDGMNSELKHLTVLEEAHNLLKRTSSEHSVDSGNLVGKSVEMIANAIAEMRTYGEGFIIADQAPGLLDMAAIRNTNTKIIMRLPDQGDRELVGKAASLNDDQIVEIAKLPCGVAAVYQNEWIQPVLCKIQRFECEHNTYDYVRPSRSNLPDYTDKKIMIAEMLSKGMTCGNEIAKSEIILAMNELHLCASLQVTVLKMIQNPPKEPRMTKLAPIMSALFPEVISAVKLSYSETHSPEEWTICAENALQNSINREIDDQLRRDIIQSAMTQYFLNEMNRVNDLREWSENGGMR